MSKLLKQHKNLISLDDPEVQKELKAYEKFIEEHKTQIARKIILDAIYTLKIEQPVISCCKRIDLSGFPNYSDEVIGQILGQQGSHKQFFINLTGVDLNVDKNYSKAIVLSKYDTVKVEKAAELIKKILTKGKKGNIKWSNERIANLFQQVNEEWDANCKEKGSKILKEFLEYESFSDELATHVGNLQFVYSFNQNILEHSLEVAQISANIAVQLDLNPLKAKRAGFFHDIGKAIANLEDHVEKGIDIATKAGLEDYIINAIASHHKKPKGVKPNNPYSLIVASADKLSAGREGARPRQMELIEKRVEMIKEEVKKLDWVDKVVVKNAGNTIEVLIKRIRGLKDERLRVMKLELKEKLRAIQSEYSYNFKITLKVFCEEVLNVKIEKSKEVIRGLVEKIEWVDKSRLTLEGDTMTIHVKGKLHEVDEARLSELKNELRQKVREVNSDKAYDFEIKVQMTSEDSFLLEENS